MSNLDRFSTGIPALDQLLGGGLIPKGAIAYAGTYVMGKGLERLYHTNRQLTRGERNGVYQAALERGKNMLQGVLKAR